MHILCTVLNVYMYRPLSKTNLGQINEPSLNDQSESLVKIALIMQIELYME